MRTKRMARYGVASIVVLALAAWMLPAWGQSNTTTKAKATTTPNAQLVNQLAKMRLATAKYSTSLRNAKKDGYGIITQMIPDMGFHFMNPNISTFDIRKPPILVYEHRGSTWQLGALEWVYTAKPAEPPFPGAGYGSFGAGCHYVDGTFVPAYSEVKCPTISPETGAAFNFWHPLLYTLHVWLWYPNPSGLFASTNPLAAAYNHG